MEKSVRGKFLFLICILAVLVLIMGGCYDRSNGTENQTTIDIVYGAAVDLGYTGTLQEFILLMSGKDGANGQDGVGIEDIEIDASGNLCITLTSGQIFNLGKIVGEKGDKGDNGEKGDKGDKGDTGEKGDKGDAGLQGETGPQGNQGLQGETGAQGNQGLQGETGAQGNQGLQGQTGKAGEDGKQGEKGESAFEIYCKYYDDYDNEKDWIDALMAGKISQPQQEVTVIFSYGAGKSASVDIIKGSKVSIPSEIDVNIDGFEFICWKTTEGDIFDFNTNINSDLTLHAYYEEKSSSVQPTLVDGGEIAAPTEFTIQGDAFILYRITYDFSEIILTSESGSVRHALDILGGLTEDSISTVTKCTFGIVKNFKMENQLYGYDAFDLIIEFSGGSVLTVTIE